MTTTAERDPHRSQSNPPKSALSAPPASEAKTLPRFQANSTASNMCGFTLMNSQVGVLIAHVLGRLENVTVTELPSMIRVDGRGRFDVVYADVDEEAGEEEGWFNAAEFEEAMSTHYGRMVHLDDRTIMFANPEDAAEHLDFDLKPVG